MPRGWGHRNSGGVSVSRLSLHGHCARGTERMFCAGRNRGLPRVGRAAGAAVRTLDGVRAQVLDAPPFLCPHAYEVRLSDLGGSVPAGSGSRKGAKPRRGRRDRIAGFQGRRRAVLRPCVAPFLPASRRAAEWRREKSGPRAFSLPADPRPGRSRTRGSRTRSASRIPSRRGDEGRRQAGHRKCGGMRTSCPRHGPRPAP